MIELNYNYESLYKDIETIEKYLLENNDDLVVLNFYKYFANLFPIGKNLKLFFLNTDSINNLIDNGIDDIYSKKDIYKKTIDSFFPLFNEKIKNLKFNNNSNSELAIISPKEQLEILKSYFQTTDKRLEKIFLKYEQERKIFYQPYSVGLDYAYGSVIYNPFNKESILFLEEADDKILEMAIVVHEFGHVLDFMTYNENNSNEDTELYNLISPYVETNSLYQEFKFYEYLLKNNLYQNSVKSLIYRNIAEDYLNIFHNTAFPDEDDDLIFQKIDMKDNVIYGYGLMNALVMLDDKDKYNKFQKIREPYFNKEKLDLAGFDDTTVSKVMIKKINEYFGGNNDKTK